MLLPAVPRSGASESASPLGEQARMNARGLFCWLFLSLFVAPGLCGCHPVIDPAKAIATNADGKLIAPPASPLVGTTTRQQVEQLYHGYRVDCGVPALYWARVYRSDSKFPLVRNGDGRLWGWFNVVTAFDSNGVTQSVNAFSDAKLIDEVASMFSQGQLPALDFAVPAKLEAERDPIFASSLRADELQVKVVIAGTNLTISETIPGKRIPQKQAHLATVVVPRTHIRRILIDSQQLDWRPSDRTLLVFMRFERKTELGSYLDFKMQFSDALTLARWVAQTSSGHLKDNQPPARSNSASAPHPSFKAAAPAQ